MIDILKLYIKDKKSSNIGQTLFLRFCILEIKFFANPKNAVYDEDAAVMWDLKSEVICL